MNETRLPIKDMKTKTIGSSHVVILGAGASRAAFPAGDAKGKKLPIMNELAEVLQLDNLLTNSEHKRAKENFEAFFSDIFEKPEYEKLVKEIQIRTVEYFRALEIPETVTLYDYLILSLRGKDIIATFNWDPLLLQAFERHNRVFGKKNLPEIAFLHGNVFMGYCKVCNDQRMKKPSAPFCWKCKSRLEDTQLLYPVLKKDYTNDSVIKFQWDMLDERLKNCYYLTFFGYSAPKTDVEARELMKRAWSNNPMVELTDIDIIDIKDREELERNWQEFIELQTPGEFRNNNHWFTFNSFKSTRLWKHPRESCEALYDATLQCEPRIPTPFPETNSLDELHKFITPIKMDINPPWE